MGWTVGCRERAWLLGVVSAACACSPSVFQCLDDTGCEGAGAQGRCEASGYCSFEDTACESGRRYGEFAGDGLGGGCVEEEPNASTGAEMSDPPGTTSLTTSLTDGAESSSGAGESTGSDDSSTGSSACPEDWWDCAWTRRQAFTLGGMPIDEPVSPLPIPLQLAAELRDDPSTVLVDGAGNMLAWEIDQSTAWVSVAAEPDLALQVWAYGGNADATPAATGAVWDDRFSAVWHLADGTDATGGDSTAVSEEVVYEPGLFGSAAVFDGVDDRFDVPASDSLADLRDEGFTVEARIKPTEGILDGYQRIFDKADDPSATLGWSLMLRGDWPNHHIEINYGYSVDERQCNSDEFVLSEWAHVVVLTHPGDLTEFWIDGELLGTTVVTPGEGDPLSDAMQAATIGAPTTGTATRFFDGTIDELRISRGVRSASWVRATYISGRPDAITVGPIEDLPR